MRAELVLGPALFLLGCEQLLDIEPAQIDPGLGAVAGSGADPGAGGDTPFDASSAGGFGGGAAETSTADGASQTNGDPDAGEEPGALGGTGGQGGSSPDAGDAGTLCEVYCDAVMTECAGAFAVYARRDNCLEVCKALPVGAANDIGENSIYCRLKAARAAPLELPFYCPAAGPGGNGVCGTNCEAFCGLAEALCDGSNQQFADQTACLAECQALPDLGTYTTYSMAAQYGGPHVQCRLFHASAAALDPIAHCGHVGGSKPCQ